MGASDPKYKQDLFGLNDPQFAARPAPQPQAVEPPRAFSRIPTHAIGSVAERRFHARAALQLPLRLVKVNGVDEPEALTLLTRNISTNGVFFLTPKQLAIGSAIELEVALVHRPLGYGSVRMATNAHVARVEECATPGWFGVGARFDEIAFDRDEPVPSRYKP